MLPLRAAKARLDGILSEYCTGCNRNATFQLGKPREAINIQQVSIEHYQDVSFIILISRW